MEKIEANLKRANLLAEKIGFEKIWNIEVTEFGVHIQAYRNMGVEAILRNLKFKTIWESSLGYEIATRGRYYKVTITTNK